MPSESIQIRGAREHNLKSINVDIPINQFTVITGLSGSGKSSLAFDTVYAEGQRRYVESLSSYARQFLGIMGKPDVDSIKGLSPAISIEQKSISHNPRSTVGTITEIYDYLRLLYARIGVPHCPLCGTVIKPQDAESITKNLLTGFAGKKVKILAPIVRGKKGNYEQLFLDLNKQGYVRVRVDGKEGEVTDYFGQGKTVIERYAPHNIEVLIDTIKVDGPAKTRLQRSIESALKLAAGLVMVIIEQHKKDAIEKVYSQHLACPDCGISFDKLQPRLFSFNSPFGACPTCHGLGFIQKFEPELIIPDKGWTLSEGAIRPQGFSVSGFFGQMLETLGHKYKFSVETPVQDLSKKIMDIIFYGTDDKIDWEFASKSTDNVWEWTGRWEGIVHRLERLYKQTDSDSRRAEMERYMIEQPCGGCGGARLKQEALAVMLSGKNIHEITGLPITELVAFLSTIKLNKAETEIGKQIMKELADRLQFLVDVGLDYLTLARRGATLSGGEGQRIRLATQIGSELRGVTYILDEPSIGLHQRDNEKLIKTLKNMRDIGNTVIVVEHDEDTILAADYVFDIGPGAGIHGGHVVAEGTPEQIKKNKKSLTGAYLSGRQHISVPDKRRRPHGFIELRGARHNNLKDINVDFPVEVLCCITGVSGSGKSSLITDTLYPILAKKLHYARVVPGAHDSIENFGYVDKVIIIDQSPIGRTPRSNPATYTGVFTYIRELFAATKEAKIRGYQPGRFSFNVEGGRCGNCEGDGVIKIEMHFLPDVYVECEQCKGQRYNEETLEVKYKDKNIAEVLNMTVEEALTFFGPVPRIKSKMQTLFDVGLGYIKLGQSATTLSGGEAQRIKLTAELSRRDTGRTLYILDEPTTGLHFADIEKLLEVLNRLVDKGNTVIVIEHNLDVVKSADYIIDLGPEGGDRGGQVIAKGTPEQIVKEKGSYTGKFLRRVV
ncbi:excinuclease ABC subunit UvrA [Candidatus Falkowbacteria bacterium]|nr:excinuclease ABC subunit UvrA [Candidatus Falkowbacteria bacterium]